MQDADFVGSLLVENIARTDKGEPSIELIVASDEKSGRLSAKAADLDRPDSADAPLLSVSLGHKGRDYELTGFEHYFTPGKKTANANPVKKRKPHVIALAGLLFLGLAAGAVWYFVVRPGASEGTLPTGADAGQEAADGLPVDSFDAEAYLREALPPVDALTPEGIPNGGVVPFEGLDGAVPPQGLSPSEGLVPASPATPTPSAREPPRVNALPAPSGPLLADVGSALDLILVFC
jgi:hypothetical protein